jgi:exodeoxyribonuclease VII large subunit
MTPLNQQVTQSPTIHTISELNQMVSSLLNDCFPITLWVTGEVSNFSCPRSGHWYFSLKDSNAQVRCVFFQGETRSNKVQLSDGLQVIVRARLRLYEHRGEFQLVVEQLEPIGDGLLRQNFEALKLHLASEGLFDNIHKKKLPAYPSTIGVITSPTGAAIRDILSILKRRFPAIQVIIYPSLVQGGTAAAEIAAKLAIANTRAECEILIVARGGGSLEDLWPFNEEIVVRAIYASHIPVVSAIGHEIDITIADFVADVRAATPSAAAELVSPNQITYSQSCNQLANRLFQAMLARLNDASTHLSHIQKRLKHPNQRLQTNWQRLDELEQRLQYACKHQLQLRKQQLAHLARALDAVSPLLTLARGYALIRRVSDGHIVHQANQVKVGEVLNSQLSTGQIISTVTEVVEG